MKKIGLVLLGILACLVVFAGCSNEPQAVTVANVDDMTYGKHSYAYGISGTFGGNPVAEGTLGAIATEKHENYFQYKLNCPTLSGLNNASFWKIGDKLYLASTGADETSKFSTTDLTSASFTYTDTATSTELTFTKK